MSIYRCDPPFQVSQCGGASRIPEVLCLVRGILGQLTNCSGGAICISSPAYTIHEFPASNKHRYHPSNTPIVSLCFHALYFGGCTRQNEIGYVSNSCRGIRGAISLSPQSKLLLCFRSSLHCAVVKDTASPRLFKTQDGATFISSYENLCAPTHGSGVAMLSSSTYIEALALTCLLMNASATCFLPNGTIDQGNNGVEAENYTPCGSSGSSMCCRTIVQALSGETPETCRPDGLCADNSGEIWRNGCTDKSWQDPGCIKLCSTGTSMIIPLRPRVLDEYVISALY